MNRFDEGRCSGDAILIRKLFAAGGSERTQGNGKSDDEIRKRVVKPMKSTQGVIHRPKPGIEVFGASNRKVTPTTRLTKGAVGGTIPERGTK